jgi:hypothetical protein
MRTALDTLAPLNDLQVASPCPVGWHGMAGDDRVRFCPQCRQHVYNLTAMTAEEATALLRQKEGKPCVRFYRRRDGTVMTADCPVGLRQIARHPWRWVAASLAAVLAGVLPGLGCGGGVCTQGEPLPPPTPGASQKASSDKASQAGPPPERKAGNAGRPDGDRGSFLPPSITAPEGPSGRNTDQP